MSLMLLGLIYLLGIAIYPAVTTAGQVVDIRCSDPPVSNAPVLPSVRCKTALSGYSWDHEAEDCILAANASCAKTRNKFRQKEKCLEGKLTTLMYIFTLG